MTCLLYGRQVSKFHPRIIAVGETDELTAALGCARAQIPPSDPFHQSLLRIQKRLIDLMGELAVDPQDDARYRAGKFTPIPQEEVDWLTEDIHALEKKFPDGFHDWAIPGASSLSASLDLARAVCRRTERAVLQIKESEALRKELHIYLNRLSDWLWLTARVYE